MVALRRCRGADKERDSDLHPSPIKLNDVTQMMQIPASLYVNVFFFALDYKFYLKTFLGWCCCERCMNRVLRFSTRRQVCAIIYKKERCLNLKLLFMLLFRYDGQFEKCDRQTSEQYSLL